MKKYLVVIITLLLIAGCGKKSSFTVTGRVSDITQKVIFIHRVDINKQVLLDSSVITKKGTFRFKIKAACPDYYQVGYSLNDFVTLLAEPGEKIELTFKRKALSSDYSVTGSKGSELVHDLDQRLLETKAKLDSLDKLYEKVAVEPGFDKRGPELDQAYLDVIRAQRKFNIAFILENMKSLVSIKALYQRINENMYVLYEPRDLQYLKIVSDSLKKYYPDSKQTKALVSDFENESKDFFARTLKRMTDTLPETKLNPELKDIYGKRIALSSLRGKYVLLSFWSADSRDCVVENLQLKEFYRTYHRQGFEIYQINVDQDEEKWKTAVRFDELPWINVREDNPLNPKNVILYNVKSLPANYLYDPKGNMVAVNIHGRTLQIKLNQIFD